MELFSFYFIWSNTQRISASLCDGVISAVQAIP